MPLGKCAHHNPNYAPYSPGGRPHRAATVDPIGHPLVRFGAPLGPFLLSDGGEGEGPCAKAHTGRNGRYIPSPTPSFFCLVFQCFFWARLIWAHCACRVSCPKSSVGKLTWAWAIWRSLGIARAAIIRHVGRPLRFSPRSYPDCRFSLGPVCGALYLCGRDLVLRREVCSSPTGTPFWVHLI